MTKWLCNAEGHKMNYENDCTSQFLTSPMHATYPANPVEFYHLGAIWGAYNEAPPSSFPYPIYANPPPLAVRYQTRRHVRVKRGQCPNMIHKLREGTTSKAKVSEFENTIWIICCLLYIYSDAMTTFRNLLRSFIPVGKDREWPPALPTGPKIPVRTRVSITADGRRCYF